MCSSTKATRGSDGDRDASFGFGGDSPVGAVSTAVSSVGFGAAPRVSAGSGVARPGTRCLRLALRPRRTQGNDQYGGKRHSEAGPFSAEEPLQPHGDSRFPASRRGRFMAAKRRARQPLPDIAASLTGACLGPI